MTQPVQAVVPYAPDPTAGAHPPLQARVVRPAGDLPQVSVGTLMATLWSRRWRLAACALACSGLSLAVASQLPKRYGAEGMMMIETRDFAIPELRGAFSFQTTNQAAARSEAQVIGSRAMAEKVVDRLGLMQNPEFNPDAAGGTRWREALHPGSWLPPSALAWLAERGLDVAPATARPEDPQAQRQAVVDAVRKYIGVHNDERAFSLYVYFQSSDPTLSAEVVNALMAAYLEEQGELKSKAVARANAWLVERLAELRDDLDKAEAKVKELRTKGGLLSTIQGNESAQLLQEATSQLSALRAARVEAEATVARAQELARGNLSRGNLVLSPMLQHLREQEAALERKLGDQSNRLGDRHPDLVTTRNELAEVRSRLRAEVSNVIGGLEAQLRVARSQEAAAAERLETVKRGASTAARDQVTLAQAMEEAEGKRRIYQSFLQRFEESTKMAERSQPDARIVSAAVPPARPFSPNLPLFGFLGLVGGLLAAAAATIGLDRLRGSFGTPEEVKDGTGIGALGMVPAVRRGRDALSRQVAEEPNSALAESLRGIRVRLRGPGRRRTGMVTMVTSAVPGEGKTSFSVAFARLAALDGLRVLLVDADFRRPTVQSVLKPKADTPFEDALLGVGHWTDAVSVDRESGLHVLAAAGKIKSPQRLLQSNSLQQVLREASLRYDLIVMDSPPILRVADPIVLARLTDAVLMVVAWKQTSRRAVSEALTRLDDAGIDVAGVVLSRVRVQEVEEYAYAGYAA